ncbi:MAG TPA: hypothetical protein ENK16_03655 [Chromatiales bacterium]|nr:hypothetical protein [Chromatiales bacterium]
MKTSIRKSAFLTTVVLLVLTAVPSFAQQERDVIEVLRAQIQSNRQALVAENLGLTSEESEKFWPVYREFQAERGKLEDRRIDLLIRFRDNFDTLTDEQAKKLLNDYLKLADDRNKLRKKYARIFAKILPQKKVLRYFQIENKIDTIIEFDLAKVVPLAE